MTIRTIEANLSVESISPIGLKRWDGLKMIADIDETEDESQCSKELKKKLESIIGVGQIEVAQWEIPYASSTPSTGTMPPVQMPSIDRKAIERVEKLIDDAQTPNDLVYYLPDAIKHGLQSAYDNKLKQLQ
jgi:phage gp29-like protein